MPKIVAYHPEIYVEKGSEIVEITMDLKDWFSDEEVLQKLAEETGAKTIGEAVVAIQADRVKKSSSGLSSARIIKVKDKKPGRVVRKWDAAIGSN